MAKPLVSIVMGSSNDWEIMQQSARALQDFGVTFDARVISAHRSPDLLFDYIKEMSAQGVQCFIAGAGGAAHLAGVIAGKTTLPVLGVPIPSKYLKGMDSLLSIVQMPKGIPVATFAIGEAGAANAGSVCRVHAGAERQAIGAETCRIPQETSGTNRRNHFAHFELSMSALHESNLTSLKFLHRGKVRDLYEVDADHLLIVQTDRLSAFDVILPTPIPGKGEVLTAVSNFWFKKLGNVIPNHLSGIDPESVVKTEAEKAQVRGRAFVTKKLKPLPIEAIVRGYLVGFRLEGLQEDRCSVRHSVAGRHCRKRRNCRNLYSHLRPRRRWANTTKTFRLKKPRKYWAPIWPNR